MPSLLSRLVLFASSYLPLWLIFAVVLRESNSAAAAGFLIVGAISLLGTWAYFAAVQRISPVSKTPAVIRRRDSDTMSYIASYVVPFAATTLTNIDQVIALGIFLFVLCIVYVNSGMIHINPVLSVVGYKLYEVEAANGEPYVILTRTSLRRGQPVEVIDIGTDVYVEKRGGN